MFVVIHILLCWFILLYYNYVRGLGLDCQQGKPTGSTNFIASKLSREMIHIYTCTTFPLLYKVMVCLAVSSLFIRVAPSQLSSCIVTLHVFILYNTIIPFVWMSFLTFFVYCCVWSDCPMFSDGCCLIVYFLSQCNTRTCTCRSYKCLNC